MILFLEILSCKNNFDKHLILIQIILLQLNLIWGQNLKYFFVFGYTDIFVHLYYIQSILDSFHITDAMDYYEYAPIYYIFNAMGIIIMGINTNVAFFILTALSYVPSTLFIYLIFKSLTKNEKISLLGVLFFAISRKFIFHGTYVIPLSLGFVIFLIIVFLLIKTNEIKIFRSKTLFNLFLILFSFILIIEHQTTTIFVAFILLLLLLSEILIYKKDYIISRKYVLLFICGFLAHWFFVQYVMVANTVYQMKKSVLYDNEVFSGALPITLGEFLLNSIDYMLIVFLAFIGIFCAYYTADIHKNRIRNIVLLILPIAIFFYIPGPAGLLGEIFLTNRLPLLMMPFVVLAMAFGTIYLYTILYNKNSRDRAIGISILIVGFFAFFSMFNSVNSPELNISWLNIESDLYFNEAEISGFSFLEGIFNNSIDAVYSDYHTWNYFSRYLSHFSKSYIIEQTDVGYINKGYIVLRIEEFKDKLLWLTEGRIVGIKGPKLYRYKYSESDELIPTSELNQKIYDNSFISIYKYRS
ncbi:hypothetical protein ANME2D_01781 [Candidatus Methanoperedens nitroreducens]|uniref:Glycosyltransferase RgtA/B/C/D-like domain-containing protein n=2 Tax=Candidatus Methanoperedens nitratireducens TaxID=1392998 RepID=A0A062V2X6_9EURY|nr:hypothetical protein ANME2D_01781 [Candidatus Methanoperedens nitroreducens]